MSIAAVVLVLCVAGFAMCGAEAFHRLMSKQPPMFMNVLFFMLSVYLGAFSMALAVQVWMQ